LTASIPGDGPRLRIFSANLLAGRADVSALAALLRELDPDVVALQEFTAEHEATLRSSLPYGDAPVGKGTSMALALRHPATVERVAGARQDVYRARLEPGSWPGLPSAVEIMASHICAPHLFPPWRTFPTRRAQVQAVLRHIGSEPDLPRVLVGDLNATPRWPAYARLSEALEDAAVVAAQRLGVRPDATWAPRRAGPRWLRIDHALVRGFEVHSLRVHEVIGSDHAALVVDLWPHSRTRTPAPIG